MPATLGLIVLAEPIVRVIFERGSFTATDTVATAAAVQLYALGLVGYSVVKIVSPTFYAIGRSRTPVAVGVAAVLLNAVLSVTSAPLFGYRGLALSASIAALFNAGALVWLARGALGGLELRRVAATGVKVLVASVLMAAAGWFAMRGLELAVPGRSLGWQMARLAARHRGQPVGAGRRRAAAPGARVRRGPRRRDRPLPPAALKSRPTLDIRGRSFSSAEARVSGR